MKMEKYGSLQDLSAVKEIVFTTYSNIQKLSKGLATNANKGILGMVTKYWKEKDSTKIIQTHGKPH